IQDLRQRLENEANANSRARVASALLHLGDRQGAESVLIAAPDPTARTAFIHEFAAWHGDLKPLPELLHKSNKSWFRSGLCAAVALLDRSRLAVEEKEALPATLIELYGQAPDGGTHSAAAWALGQWKLPLPPLPTSPFPPAGQDWFVNVSGMTMIRI